MDRLKTYYFDLTPKSTPILERRPYRTVTITNIGRDNVWLALGIPAMLHNGIILLPNAVFTFDCYNRQLEAVSNGSVIQVTRHDEKCSLEDCDNCVYRFKCWTER
jgi:hypothetical protein